MQAKEADRYDPAMATLLGNLEMLGRGQLGPLRRLCGVDEEDFADMVRELRAYDPELGAREQIVVATKIDALDEPDRLNELRARAEQEGRKFFAISSVTGSGVRELINVVAQAVEQRRAQRIPRSAADEIVVGTRSGF